MRKIVLYIAMSLDGFIADEHGSVSFLEDGVSEHEATGTYDAFIQTVDTVIMGYQTYAQVNEVLSPDHWPYEDLLTYVITSKKRKDLENIKFINHPSLSFFESIKSAKGKDIFLCGGAKVVNLVHRMDFIDLYRITIIPMILGKGIPLFDALSDTKRLKLNQVETNQGMVELVYEKR